MMPRPPRGTTARIVVRNVWIGGNHRPALNNALSVPVETDDLATFGYRNPPYHGRKVYAHSLFQNGVADAPYILEPMCHSTIP
jgi:hypothetical protein